MVKTAREKILDAALPLFVDHGLAAVRTEDIRTAAGVSNGSLFHAFASKEAIAAALYVEAIASYQAALMDELDGARAAEATIRSLIRAHWAWIAANERKARFLFGMGRPDWNDDARFQTREMNVRLDAQFAEWWRSRVKSGEVLDLPPSTAGAILFGPSLTAMRAMLGSAQGKPPRGMANALADAAVRALIERE
jgi:AcrR family transcriptional regulator